MKRSDSALTLALCVSLTAHAGLFGLVLHEKIAELNAQLHTPPLVAQAIPDDEADQEKNKEEAPAALILPPPQVVKADRPITPPPPPPPEHPKQPKAEDENSEWGEKDKTGFALTSTPGKQDMQARKGAEDQSLASRDPEGPELLPEDPSMTTVPPGQNGGGQSGAKMLADKGTRSQDDPNQPALGQPNAHATPPAPIPKHTVLTWVGEILDGRARSGPSRSAPPQDAPRSLAEADTKPAEEESLPNDPARGAETQILPVKQADVIGIRSNKPKYPEMVVALTQPPGVRIPPQRLDPLDDAALANVARADRSGAPEFQPATAALEAAPGPVEEMAQRLGAHDPRNGPVLVEAMTHAPGKIAMDGGEAVLADPVPQDQPESREIQDVIAALEIDRPQPEKPAEKLERVTPIIAAANKPAINEKKTAAATPTAVASGPGGAPGPEAAADPAKDVGLESDPFAKIPGVEFHDGKVEARSGRQIKPIRPRLTEAGMRDLLAQQFPTVLLKVRIDKTGKVVDVNIVRGSGSEAVDMPVYRALWGWWFEPPKDQKGNAVEDVQLVAIHWG